jgi:alanine dehydrogenase
MFIGVPKEIKKAEARVGLTPVLVRELKHQGHSIVVEEKAGEAIGFYDEMYGMAGAKIVKTAKEVYEAEFIVKVKEPQEQEYPLLKKGQILFCYLHLAPDPKLTQALVKSGIIGIAYETVSNDCGGLPLLEPMSVIAGRMSITAGADCLQLHNGGKGLLIGGVAGVAPARVVILGGGTAGFEAARMAVGLGADVTLLEVKTERLHYLETYFKGRVKTLYSTTAIVEESLKTCDLVIGAVLIAGKKTPKLVTKSMLSLMEKGSAVVDISIDQGGCFETSKPTTHDKPTYCVDEIVHYCVANMPGAYARTATLALNNVTFPYVKLIAEKGTVALLENKHLQHGLNVYLGNVTCEPVAIDLGYAFISFEKILSR